jgi:hypothetical protein
MAIYPNNTNTVDMFSSLCAGPTYNSILISVVDLLVSTSITTKVYFVPGSQNIVANALSRFLNAKALQLAPRLKIQPFEPPQDARGAAKK